MLQPPQTPKCGHRASRGWPTPEDALGVRHLKDGFLRKLTYSTSSPGKAPSKDGLAPQAA